MNTWELEHRWVTESEETIGVRFRALLISKTLKLAVSDSAIAWLAVTSCLGSTSKPQVPNTSKRQAVCVSIIAGL